MSGTDLSEQVLVLRAEAAEARRLALTMSDQQAIADLNLYADALEAELAELIEGLAVTEAEPKPLAPYSQESVLTRLFTEHA